MAQALSLYGLRNGVAMKILGHTPENDLIIQVSQAEWDELQNRIEPTDSKIYERYNLWPDTEIGKLFLEKKGTRGLTAVRYAYLMGEIDGTLKNLNKWIDGRVIKNLGRSSYLKLKNLISEQLEKQ